MERRHFLTVSAATIGGVLVYSLDRKLSRVSAQEKTVHIPLHFFEEGEALIVAAAVARIFPSDETGPGAKEAAWSCTSTANSQDLTAATGIAIFRDPFETGVPEMGYQGKATRREIYREGVKKLPGFDHLSPAEQDAALREIESTEFFVLLRQNTIEGMFCDPMHSGTSICWAGS